ncbi:MAG: DHHA1 domain-containing protein [Ruminococcus callidus]
MALKLVAALDGAIRQWRWSSSANWRQLTIADVVNLSGRKPLSGTAGAAASANTERGAAGTAGKSGLLGKSFTSTSVAFGIAPRINAAGRFGSPKTAVELLLCEDPDEAAELAEELERRNQARKAEEVRILEEIAEQAAENPRLLKERVLVFAGEGWHHGVIGIAASRLEEQFGKPTILITLEGDRARGSMRSFGAFSAFRCLHACRELLSRYGGHPGAGGFSLPTEHVERFRQAVQQYAKESNPVMPVLTLEADKLLMPQEITMENITGLRHWHRLAKAIRRRCLPLPRGFAKCPAAVRRNAPAENHLRRHGNGSAAVPDQTEDDAENWRCVIF